MYSEEGQEIAAKNYYRPRNEEVLEKYKDQFQSLELITIEDFGGWQEAQKHILLMAVPLTKSINN